MIRVVMLGRTGNNLFQYAFGRVLAARHGVPLVMDGSWFNRRDWQAVSCLQRLPLRAEIVRKWPVAARVLRRVAGRHPWEWRGVPVVRESAVNLAFAPRLLEAPRSCVVFGYFQTPRYFAGIEAELRQSLALDGLAWPARVRRLADRLAGEPSVAVHVRRTDYLGNPDVDILGDGYYRRAMDRLRAELGNPRFHVFSDDPDACAKVFTSGDCEVRFPEDDGLDPLADLFLMSSARHHVLANSSYSWWAAWLGKKPAQRVIMPAQWYRGEMIAPIGEKRCDGWELEAIGD